MTKQTKIWAASLGVVTSALVWVAYEAKKKRKQ